MTAQGDRPIGIQQASTPRWVRIAGVPAMVIIGALTAVQALMTGTLRHELGTGLRASALAAIISMAGGMVVIGLVTLTNERGREGVRAIAATIRARSQPWWMYVGGGIGSFFVVGQAVAVTVIGISVFSVAGVAGQTAGGLLVDRAGVGPGGVKAISTGRVIAALLAVAAVVITSLGGLGAGLTLAALALVLMPLVGGAGTAFQQAVNGRIGAFAGALPAAFLNMAVGTIVTSAFLAVTLLLPGSLGPWPSAWWLYLAGVIGAIFIGSAAALVHIYGVLTLSLCVIAGQVIGAEVLSAVSPTAEVTWASLLAMALVVVGVLVALMWTGPRKRVA